MKEIKICYSVFEDTSVLSEADRALVQRSIDISDQAYAVYSSFYVGAALLLENGETITGNNQENIAFPSGLCAERVALFYAGAQYPNVKIMKLAIYGAGELQGSDGPVTPCGSCRQVISETIRRQNEGFELYLIGKNGRVIHFQNALDLLPMPFGVE